MFQRKHQEVRMVKEEKNLFLKTKRQQEEIDMLKRRHRN